MRPTGAKRYGGVGTGGMGHMANKACRGYGVQGVWGTWAIGHNDTFNLNHLSPHRAIFFSCVELYYFSEHDRKTMAPSSEEGEANGKRGVEAAHVASSQVGGESAIGLNSTQGKSGREQKSNFPPKKKF